MENKGIDNMKEYCELIKKYFQMYQNDKLNVQLNGSKQQELKAIINDGTLKDDIFFIHIEELIGETIRILNGYNRNIEFFSWIGGEERFTKEKFIAKMAEVWPYL